MTADAMEACHIAMYTPKLTPPTATHVLPGVRAHVHTRHKIRTAWHGTTRHDTTQHDTARHGTARHGTAWHGTALAGWNGMVRDGRYGYSQVLFIFDLCRRLFRTGHYDDNIGGTLVVGWRKVFKVCPHVIHIQRCDACLQCAVAYTYPNTHAHMSIRKT